VHFCELNDDSDDDDDDDDDDDVFLVGCILLLAPKRSRLFCVGPFLIHLLL